MKLVKNKFWINKECPTVKKNQHIYKMFLKTINESWKCLKGELTERDYENTIKKIFIQVNCLYNDNLGIARNTSIGKAAYVKVVDDFHTIIGMIAEQI